MKEKSLERANMEREWNSTMKKEFLMLKREEKLNNVERIARVN